MTEESILLRADRLINGPRQESYDHPHEDFSLTGRIWGALLERWRESDDPDVPPELVGLMMAALKMVRETHKHEEDNLADGAGYFGCVQMIHDRYAEDDEE